MDRRVSVRGIITNPNGEILAVRHKKEDGSAASFWAIPGGGLDPMEPIHNGVKRELIEELGVEAEIGQLLLVQQFKDPKNTGDPREHLEFFFEITNYKDFVNASTQGTSHGEVEIADVAFVNPKEVTILPTILATDEFAEALRGEVTAPLFHIEL